MMPKKSRQESIELHHPSNNPPERQAMPVDTEDPPRLAFPVVGIGASAGGLEAVGEFLSAMPADSGMAFVLIQHLPPDHESMMAEILSRRTTMKVQQVEDGMPIVPNNVYVIRPGHTLVMRGGKIHLGERLTKRSNDRPIDDFFRSLAEEHQERGIGIILSGMGSNGTAGAQAIKAVGGMCIAQDPESALFPSMPRHLIDAGYADYILRPADMPDVLTDYARHPYASGGREQNSDAIVLRDQQHLREILAVLHTRTKTDFRGYKKPTVLRRIQRRMGLTRLTQISDYAKLLRQSPTEVTALADDLLVHVTGFFRDSDAWETLRKTVIVPLIESREADVPVRAWVTACSSGEEAYTIAMLLVEEAERAGKALDIKVFATDMADRSLQNARQGLYPGGIETEITPERLDRFFQKDDAMYRVRQELRERVIFAPQNVLQDPPFSRLDIITCRNLLIYLEPEVQQRLLALLHFGLRENGTLFLGTSETVGSQELFEPIDKKARIFRRIGPTRHGTFNFPLLHAVGQIRQESQAAEPRGPLPRPTMSQMATRALLLHHTPAAVVVDREFRISYFHGDTDRFLQGPRGEPTRDLMMLMRDGLRRVVRNAMNQAVSTHTAATMFNGWVEVEPGRRVRVAVSASPLDSKNAPDQFVISFSEQGDAVSEPAGDGTDPANVTGELRRARDELQSAVEELQTSNKELQSTNEEMETSREEMQSLNEELSTVNSQLHAKMDELQSATNDLASLLTSTDIAVLFLDPQFRIRRFTPLMRELLEMIVSDVGRPISDLAMKFSDPDLLSDAQTVLERLVPSEKEVPGDDNRWFLRRITPYRTVDNRIDGVVITFVDTTERRRAEEVMRRVAARDAYIVTLTDALRPLADGETIQSEAARILGQQISANRVHYAKITEDGYVLIQRNYAVGVPEITGILRSNEFGATLLATLNAGNNVVVPDVEHSADLPQAERKAYAALSVGSMVAVPLIKNGRCTAAFVVQGANPRQWTPLELSLIEETAERTWAALERAHAEERLRDERFRSSIVSGYMGFWDLSVETGGVMWEPTHNNLLGLPADQKTGTMQQFLNVVHPEDRAAVQTAINRALASGTDFNVEFRVVHPGGSVRWIADYGRWIAATTGKSARLMGGVQDITDRKESENERIRLLESEKTARAEAEAANHMKDEFLATLSHELRTPLSVILLWSKMLSGRIAANPAELEKGLSAIQHSAEAQKELIEDLLDVSRITAGKLRLHKRQVDFLPIVQDAVEGIRPTADAKGVSLRMDLRPEVGVILADPDRLRQIVWNLVNNAVKFTPAGGNVNVSIARSDGHIKICVADTGKGIKPEFLPYVFDRFRQGEGAHTRSDGGLGLGLAITKQLVELHGGDVGVESKGTNQGATFTVEMPLPRIRAGNLGEPVEKDDTPATVLNQEALVGLKVLLVEDDAGTREVTAALLREAGVEVAEAISADAAIDSFEQSTPDIIISDIGLPEKDGYALIREIREIEAKRKSPRIPAIALTAFVRETDRLTAMNAGFQDHLAKPVDPDRLISVLLSTVQMR